MSKIAAVAAFFSALGLIGTIFFIGYGLFGGDAYAAVGEPVTRDGLTVTLQRAEVNPRNAGLEFLVSGLEEDPLVPDWLSVSLYPTSERSSTTVWLWRIPDRRGWKPPERMQFCIVWDSLRTGWLRAAHSRSDRF